MAFTHSGSRHSQDTLQARNELMTCTVSCGAVCNVYPMNCLYFSSTPLLADHYKMKYEVLREQ
jgi:hypothetical protein